MPLNQSALRAARLRTIRGIGRAQRDYTSAATRRQSRLAGIDVRIFGFTDTLNLLHDAGDAARCAAAMLESGGGNNDAAGLLHLAGVDHESRHRAKLLVMVSDGLPTEILDRRAAILVDRLENREHMGVDKSQCGRSRNKFPPARTTGPERHQPGRATFRTDDRKARAKSASLTRVRTGLSLPRCVRVGFDLGCDHDEQNLVCTGAHLGRFGGSAAGKSAAKAV